MPDSLRERIQRELPLLLVAVVGLLAVSVILQIVICIRMFFTHPVAVTNSAIPVAVTNSRVPVAVTDTRGHERLRVWVDSPVDVNGRVDVGNIGDIDVKLNNHHIIRADPIPVRIVR